MNWRCLSHTFDLSVRGEIMGILNVTPDSFSDGGRFSSVGTALTRARTLIEEGAAILDIGGESTRPGAEAVNAEEELQRVLPVIEAIHSEFPDQCLSVDTSKASVARRSIEAGASIINDVTGFREAAMVEAAAETGAGLVAMHMKGTPRTMQSDPHYDDVVAEVKASFRDCFEKLTAAGVDPETIAFDPGIGFGKTLEHNLELIRSLDRLSVEGRPILLGVSRKSFIGKLLGSEKLEDRSAPTIAITSYARELGVPLHRVHEVEANLQALRMTESMR